MKKCTKCLKRKPLTQFSKHAPSKDGLQPICKDCNKAYLKIWQQRPGADKIRYEKSIEYRYGITAEHYYDLLKKQGGACAICRKPMDKRLCVDHNHVTHEVRGLLCHLCNLGIGNLQDSEFLLESALAYIRAHRKE